MKKRKITFGSLFRGVAGFDGGFEDAGMECAWAVEIDEDCNAVCRRHWPKVPIVLDIHDAGKKNLSRVDVIAFGSPCQDFSVAGNRAGITSERSGLFHEAIRVVRELSPGLVVWENVPGVFSSFTAVDPTCRGRTDGRGWDEDSDFLAVLSAMADLRPVELAWRVFDSQWFGVAQRRRRVFLVADFGGERAKEILALSESMQGHPAPRRKAGQGVAGSVAPYLRSCGVGSKRIGDTRGQDCVIPIQEVSKRTGNSTNNPRAGIGIGNEGDPMFTFQRGAQHGIARTLSDNLARGGIPSTDGLDGSLIPEVAACLNQGAHPNNMIVRRLTPRECERLQGFPDDFTAWGIGENGKRVEMSDSARYRMLGNAVTRKVSQWLGKRIVAVMKGKK